VSDIRDLIARAEAFSMNLRKVKESLPGIEWYRYEILSVFHHLDKLLAGENRTLLSGQGAILDIGCADGDLAFFLESLGFDVVALDHPAFNHNGMRGVRALKQALGSKIEIQEADIDRLPALPQGDFFLTFFLGTLYHLRNPLFVLETLARSSRYCLLSTRVARRFPGAEGDAPLVYLLDDQELNADDSNYFIFSNPALKIALKRTYWDVMDYMTVGDTETSDAVSLDRDERAYGLLRSNFGMSNIELGEGWYAAESSGWRWTSRTFSAAIHLPAQARSRTLAVRGFLPSETLARLGPIRMAVTANGAPLPAADLRSEGTFQYEAPLEAALGPHVQLTFALDKALPATEADPRELGVIIASIGTA
jgi:SAM-dependent methyltransferase